MIVNKSLYPISSNLRTISTMQSQFDNLQLQLATGKRYNSLAEMGNQLLPDLNIRARLGRIEGYQANILTAETRLSFYNNSLTRLDEIEADARALAVPNAYGTDGINFINIRNQSTNMLKEVIDVLNTDITGQYIFSGNASDTKPVASFDEIMYGANGFVQYVQDRNGLDGVGTGGEIAFSQTGSAIRIAHADTHDYGFKLETPTTSNPAAISITPTAADAGEPIGSGFSVSFAAQPAPGDTVTIAVTYPHDRGEVKYLTFTAAAPGTDPLPADSFLIGTDAAETAANFSTTVGTKLDGLSNNTLRSSSTYAAADRFFNAMGEASEPGIVSWYGGQEGTNPRQSVTVNIDEHTKAHYGVQANEQGFVELIKGLAVFAVAELAPLNEDNAARYDALVDIQRNRLSEINNAKPGSIEGITMELGLAAATLNTVKERHTQYDAQLKTMLAGIETAPREEIAMMLLDLQVQLQASYQATVMASQLTLANYLR